MKQHRSGIIRSLIFISLLIVSLLGINRVTRPKYDYSNSSWPTTSTYEQFYDMSRDSIDVLFLGSSVMVNAVSPQQIYRTYGIRCYNLGSENQSPVISYYWLKEALRYQSPKAVVMDCRFLFSLHKENPLNMIEGLVRKSIDPMKWSSVKMAAVHDICSIDEGQDELSYYLTNLRYHERWKVLTIDDYDTSMQSAPLKGFAPIYENGPETYETFVPSDTAAMTEFDEHMGVYLDKITDLCKEEGIRLILIDLPGNQMNDSINNLLTSYASDHGIEYLNYCEESLYRSIGAVLPEENVTAHANLPGALKFSDAIGKYLRETAGIQAVPDEQYTSCDTYHEHSIRNDLLKKTDDFETYLSLLNDPAYTVFISVSEDAGADQSENIRQLWSELGLSVSLQGMYEAGYTAVISDEGIYEEAGQSFLSHTAQFMNRHHTYTIESAGRSVGSWSSVRIDSTEYSRGTPGINIVVFDEMFSKVIDSVTYETYTETFARAE